MRLLLLFGAKFFYGKEESKCDLIIDVIDHFIEV
jgi:hypothetical protein